jgi:Glu-tRNA(Gln) amidotransferase subunit E-like FAD-binding protein
MDYKKLNLKIGLEVHKQIDSHKLFCNCPSILKEGNPDFRIKRELRSVISELGEIDIVAEYEQKKGKYYIYEGYSDVNCLVELDESPPEPLNKESLNVALKIAMLLNTEIINEIQVMRKQVLDGSNTTSFQRTALIAMNGFIETSEGKVKIPTISLEEDAARKVKETKEYIVYKLDRLGFPLIEIVTSPEIHSPQQAKETAEKIGMILKSTGKVKRGIGTVRQDINLSIKDGARVEIKGFQDLRKMPTIIENEIQRQLNLIKRGKKVKAEVRKVNPDGTTSYMRPMPGASRIYVETDIPPVLIDKNILNKIKLPELLEDKKKKYEKILNKELASQIINSSYLNLFEKYFKSKNPKLIANILVNTIPDIKRRENLDVSKITEKHLEELFDLIEKGKITKDYVYEILKEVAGNPKKSVKDFIIKTVSENEARKIIRNIIKREKTDKINVVIGEAIKELKGRMDGRKIAEIVKKEIKK